MADSYLVLARKYRPQTFADLVGQEHIVRTLTNAIEQNRVHHAYLFTGSRGLGKTSTARILARSLNCEKGPTATPCNECAVCKQIAAGQGSDAYALTEIDGASNNSVDDIRDLRSRIGQKTGARYHIIVIDEVHMLSGSAFNALLKTLEEPPPHVKFVFATTEIQKVPETIISRCQRLDFRRIPAATIATYIRDIAKTEKIDAEDEALKLIARIAEGGMRDSLSKLDQAIAFCGNTVKAVDVERIFGILSRRNLLELVRGFAGRDFEQALGVAARCHDEGLDVSQVLRDLIDLFRDLAVVKTCGASTPLVDAMADDRATMEEVAGSLETDTLLYAVDILMEGLARIRSTGFPRLALEMTFIKLCELEDLVPLPALIDAVASGSASGAMAGTVTRPRPATATAPTPKAQATRQSAPASQPAPASAAAADDGGGRRIDFGSVADSLKGGADTKSDDKPKRATKKKSEVADEATPAATPEPAPAPAPAASGNGHAAPAPVDDTRSFGARLADNLNAPPRQRGPGAAAQLRDQDAVKLLIEKFEGEIIRVEETER
ncbi:MAG: DNA polymerase III subunit gamma/tau [Planctomycetota bacterium]